MKNSFDPTSTPKPIHAKKIAMMGLEGCDPL